MWLWPLLLSLAPPSQPSELLLARGLSRREVECVLHRHYRRTRHRLTAHQLMRTLRAVDQHALLPGQERHLLRSVPVLQLREICQTRSGWCSYKKSLCDCSAPLASAADDSPPLSNPPLRSRDAPSTPPAPQQAPPCSPYPPPRLLAFDCEFKPARFAAVDEEGRVRLEGLVRSGEEDPPLPGLLSCDKPGLPRLQRPQLQAEMAAMASAGCTLVAHTPARDLEVIGMEGLAVVDVARMGVEPGKQSISLRRMAAEHLNVSIQQGGHAHCAVQDARVAMALYKRLSKHENGTE